MLDILQTITVFIIAMSILITVHEYGHFLVARRCGVFIECFSIGFGKTLISWYDRYGTRYIICLFPFGGYVKMFSTNTSATYIRTNLQPKQNFNNQSLLHQAAIISAGPIANFILAIICYWVVFVYGITNIKPIIHEVKEGSIAFQSGIPRNMEFKSIGDIETYNWNDVRMALITQIGSNIPVKLVPFNQVSTKEIVKSINLHNWHINPNLQDPIISIGIQPYQSKTEFLLDRISPYSIASKIGLQDGDKILKVNGQQLKNWPDLMKLICDNFNHTIKLVIKRNSQIFSVYLSSNRKDGVWKNGKCFFGAIPHYVPLDDRFKNQQKYNPIAAVLGAERKTWQLSKLTFRILKKVIIGKISLNTISGPISIAQGASISAKHGWLAYLMFLALISINLGIINLLPLPILDGGYLLFILIEKIKRQSISDKFKHIIFNIGTILVILLMALAIFNDCSRILVNITK
ncbi:MAG: sigma E protease regulator RseP [Candidatus Dasytiphilus stammeri]